MVTKHRKLFFGKKQRLILAKIHMVTKQVKSFAFLVSGLILAKIHMVTKPQIHNNINLTTN